MAPRPSPFPLLCAVVLATAGCATSPSVSKPAAGPPPEDARAYYPLSAGWRWAYELEKGGERILATYAVDEVAGDTVIMVAGDERLLYAVLPEGVARKDGLAVSDYVVKSPVRAGATWPLSGGVARVTAVGQTVTVPAGTFVNCAVVEEERTNPSRVIRTTFGPQVGPVAVEYQIHDAATGKFETALRATLLGVTRPGEDPLGAP